jgi:hypothetical protein
MDSIFDTAFLAAASDLAEGAGTAWKFLIRVGAAAIFGYGAFKISKESKMKPWKLHLNSILIAAAMAFLLSGGDSSQNMADYDGMRPSADYASYEPVVISKTKRIENFFIVAAFMAAGVAIGVKTRA